uniref:Uncharacterized protein n=1 Tax=Rhizophora mucronata TaxID=61149 RepID=A0A2P2LY43_RHIMU
MDEWNGNGGWGEDMDKLQGRFMSVIYDMVKEVECYQLADTSIHLSCIKGFEVFEET